MKRNIKELLSSAKKALKYSYSPYSGYKVGAAVITGKGNIYSGTNVENASLGLTVCAERNAVFKAVMSGDKTIKSVCIICNRNGFPYPCGACLQVISEFGKDMEIIVADKKLRTKRFKLTELLPKAFSLNKKSDKKE